LSSLSRLNLWIHLQRIKGGTGTMRATIFILLFAWTLLIPSPSFAMDHRELVEYWAPHIYQQTSPPSSFKDDQFTAFDFDLDWRRDNNWANLSYYPPKSLVYYSVHETSTHYFIGYYLYYPRTSGNSPHANLMTGSVLVIAKTDVPSGDVQVVTTYEGDDWRWFSPNPRANGISVDLNKFSYTKGSPLSLTVTSSASGSRHMTLREPRADFNGIKYYYGGEAKIPEFSPAKRSVTCSYQLLPIKFLQMGLNQSLQPLPSQFVPRDSLPNPPWTWGNKTLDLWNRPAESLARQVSGIGTVSLNYLTKP
jgi:hypothetical protein